MKIESLQTTVVLVVGKGCGAYRGYNLEELHQAGRRVWLFDDEELEPAEHGLITEFRRVDFDGDACGQAATFAEELIGQSFDVGICYIESLLPWSSEFFDHLGVEFISSAEARSVRSKYQIRAAFESAGMSTPRHDRGTPAQLLKTKQSFPLVVKPEFGYSSIGVELIRETQELTAYFERDNNVHADTYVVEGLIEGNEFSIEGYIRDGTVTAFGLTTKFKTPPPYFEEVGQFCSRQRKLDDAHRSLFEQAARSLGIQSSPFHFEYIEKDGVCTPVEIGARLAGDKIPYLHRRVSGRSILLDYLGDDVTFPKVDSDGLGIVFFVPSKPGVVDANFPPESLGDALGEHFYEAAAGKVIKTAPDDFFVRMGFCVVGADSIEQFVSEANARIGLFEIASGVELHRLPTAESESRV